MISFINSSFCYVAIIGKIFYIFLFAFALYNLKN